MTQLSRPFARAVLRRRAEGKPDIITASEPKGTRELVSRGVARFKLDRAGLPREFANVGRNHPDYGLTTEEHNAMKWARAQGWDVPQSYDDVRDVMQSWAGLDCEFAETYGNGVWVSQGGPLPADLVDYLQELGGPVKPGQPHIVGEIGQELYVPAAQNLQNISDTFERAERLLSLIKKEGGAE